MFLNTCIHPEKPSKTKKKIKKLKKLSEICNDNKDLGQSENYDKEKQS